MTFRDGPSTLMKVLALADGDTIAGWGAVARSPHGRKIVMFGPVVTTEAHLAFASARVHSNNSAEMSAIVEALSFLGHHGPVDRDACSCVFYDSKHAAGVCLGTIHARTHVQLGHSCQQLLLKVQRRLRFTMQHVYSHAENFGNECADHAAALGAFGLVSKHNLSTRWARQSFDSVSCFDICHNLVDVLEKKRDIRTARVCLPAPDQELALCSTTLFFLPVSSSSWLFLGRSLGSIFYSFHD